MGMREVTAKGVTIASGASLSSPVFLGDKILSAIILPASWTAAALTFQVSPDGGTTWYELCDDGGNAITVASPSAGAYLQMDPSNFLSVECVKVRSGTSGTPVAQGAVRNIQLVSSKFFSTVV